MKAALIRGGTVADGSGGEPYRADVRFKDGIITEVGPDLAPTGDETVIDATGLLVTPGFVDVHTHYDGQATWDSDLSPSCYHGVTTHVMGNCGVGFAPVKPEGQQRLIEFAEGVEDIPGEALNAGMTWGWESFGEYLDKLEERQFTMDVGTHVPHAALRAYVMGDRAGAAEATPDDIARMQACVREGMQAGALGFSSSRMIAHTSTKGEIVPGTFANEEELTAIADVLAELGTGVFEVVPRGMDGEVSEEAHAEMDWMARVARRSGRPMVFSLVQTHTETDRWQTYLEWAAKLQADGVAVYPEVSTRPAGVVFSFESDFNPFSTRPSFKALEHLPFADLIAELRKPEVRAAILSEPNGRYRSQGHQHQFENFANMFPISEPIEWEPSADQCFAAMATKAGISPDAYCYDYMLGNDGRNIVSYPYTNYSYYRMDESHQLITHPTTLLGLGDGGAHSGIACDAGNTTVGLTFWTRDRAKGPKVPLGEIVRKMTSQTAGVYGLNDRGRLSPGYRADINIIDYERLEIFMPEMVHDLPAGARRIMQRPKGYVATFVAGVQTIANDELTGNLPGRVVRGAKQAPA